MFVDIVIRENKKKKVTARYTVFKNFSNISAFS